MRCGVVIGVALGLAVVACGPPDGLSGDDVGASDVSIGFSPVADEGDETIGDVDFTISLSEPADHAITARLTVGGTATPGEDYVVPTGDLLFLFAGDPNTFGVLRIIPDNEPEQEETIELHLVDVDGARVENGTYTFTIRNNVLPRITFDTSQDSLTESLASASVNVSVMPASDVPISFDLDITGTASPDDYTLPALPITIPAGATSVQIPIGQVNDSLNENNETIIMTLANPVNAIVGATAMHTHVILDEDPSAHVQFTADTQTVVEGNTGMKTVTATVQLDSVVGRTVSVPFSATSMSAVAGTDYAVITPSPLVFAPGETSKTISVVIYGDVTQDGTGDIALTLANSEALTGYPYVHHIFVSNDDCVGAGSFMLCPDAVPATTVTFNDTMSSDGTFSCAATQAPGWTAAGHPDACFVYARDIVINSVRVMGGRPVVFFATNSITVNTLLDAGSHNDSYAAGAGSNPSACGAFGAASTGAGGAGGSFVTVGGAGGSHSAPAGSGGQPPTATPSPTLLRGGCTGQSPDALAGSPGRGGGAVYLISLGTITIAPGATVNVSGGPAQGSSYGVGGSGGGSGGMLVLYAPTITASSSRILANGGAGGEGSPSNGFGNAGSEVAYASPTVPAAGGTGTTGGDGGAGAAQGATAGPGASANNSNGGGGGGGGLGYILTSTPLSGALVSPTPVPL